jgi:hypothetical protein
MVIKHTTWPQNIQNGSKIYHLYPFQDPPMYTKIWISPSGKPVANCEECAAQNCETKPSKTEQKFQMQNEKTGVEKGSKNFYAIR